MKSFRRAGLNRNRVTLVVLLTLVAGIALPGIGALAGPASPGASSTTTPRPLPRSLAWAWPLVPVPRVVRGFDPPAQPWLSGHRGVDLAAAQGASVLAPARGVVTFAGVVVDRPVLTITLPDGLRISLEPVRTALRPGAVVSKGQVVGTVAGKTHCDAAGGSCLHWGVRRSLGGAGPDGYLDPLQFLYDRRPSILLPLEASGTAPRTWKQELRIAGGARPRGVRLQGAPDRGGVRRWPRCR